MYKKIAMEEKAIKISEVLFGKTLEGRVQIIHEGGVRVIYMKGKRIVGETEDAMLIIKFFKKDRSNFITLTTGIIPNTDPPLPILENFNMEDISEVGKDYLIIKNAKKLTVI